MTDYRQEVLDALAEKEAHGCKWISITGSGLSKTHERVADSMVAEGLLDKDDGLFYRFDPDRPLFRDMLIQAFLVRGWATELANASKYADWTLARAEFDGQGGWNFRWKVNPVVWDCAFAHNLAQRYHDYYLDEEF